MNSTLYDVTKDTSLPILYQSPPGCDFTQPMPNYEDSAPRCSAFQTVVGSVVDVRQMNPRRRNCSSCSYELTVQTASRTLVNVVVSDETYCVDCGYVTCGSEIIVFYEASTPPCACITPTYQAAVIAFAYRDRMVKADFYDCYLVSQDYQLQLEITNNTYVVDSTGKPYCGTLSNQYLVVLYSEVSDTKPALTNPNTVIVL